ncbi:GvpL/GvpF family gas vesicle protein [Leptolyngbya sp. FACHB-17]|uniref:gas vesicle protein GvpF n=1 Tax=unclassified Leptolyngbya TaxID=2650499 RepID=UPI001680E500|nr:GvpL/GvpF family gas vesicle protein [Leptolyngbya sp. FACHB-17]MBD2080876.1 GvpL/GvpF family gas vesicle protein [Leptolyngbya sp. FACHB-17]
MSNLYLYGIFPAPGPQNLELQGLDQKPVQTEIIDGFAFLYSEAKQDRYLASRRNLLGHEKVLEQAMRAGYRTLLPLQFGLTIDTWETVAHQLTAPHSDHLHRLFEKLSGHREVSIKLFWDSAEELKALMAQDAALRTKRDSLEGKSLSMDEIVHIGQAIEQAMNDRRESIVAAFQTTLNSMALEAVENELLTEAMIYNAAYLIPWDLESEFSQKVEWLDQQFEGRLKIRYNDFTAPYNFAQFDQG